MECQHAEKINAALASFFTKAVWISYDHIGEWTQNTFLLAKDQCVLFVIIILRVVGWVERKSVNNR